VEGTKDIVLTQADLFRDIGERLRAGIGRTGKQEDTPLEAIIYFTGGCLVNIFLRK